MIFFSPDFILYVQGDSKGIVVFSKLLYLLNTSVHLYFSDHGL